VVGYDLKEFVKQYGFDCELLKLSEHDFALIKQFSEDTTAQSRNLIAALLIFITDVLVRVRRYYYSEDERADLGRVPCFFTESKFHRDVLGNGETRKTNRLFGSQYPPLYYWRDSYDARHTAPPDPRHTYVASGNNAAFAGPVLRRFNL